MAEEQAPADLALALTTHARLFDHLRRRQASIHALRAYHADNATMLQHLEVCLEDGSNYKVNVACSQSGFTPIFAACLQGDPTAVKMLLAFGADVVAECGVVDTHGGDNEDKCKEFPLSVAAREGHRAVVEMLLAHKGVDPNQGTSDTGSTSLFVACRAGNTVICEILLRQDGIEVNKARTDDGTTPLYAACYDGHVGVV